MQIRVLSAGYEVAHPQIRLLLATVRMAFLIESHVELPVILARMLWGSTLSGSMVLCGCGNAGGSLRCRTGERDLDAAYVFDEIFVGKDVHPETT
jgi:hypothetical protein